MKTIIFYLIGDTNPKAVSIVDKLQPISEFKDANENAACIAASISSVRLIDNIIF